MSNTPPDRTRITIGYLFAVACIYGATSIAWLYLGHVTQRRTEERDQHLRAAVGRIWGAEHRQLPPTITAEALPAPARQTVGPASQPAGRTVDHTVGRTVDHMGATPPDACHRPAQLEPRATRARATLSLDHRRKGLLWYSTYKVRFEGRYRLANASACARPATILVPLPSRGAAYDDFVVALDGTALPFEVKADGHQAGAVARVRLAAGQRGELRVAYTSRGLSRWTYAFGATTGRARDFDLQVITDFDRPDFPDGALAPTSKRRTDGGWRLRWRFDNLLSGSSLAVVMPTKLNPGPLSAEISRFAPVSLLFFFSILLLVSVLRRVPLHPVHYGMLAAAFFAFHLLLAYLVDQIPLGWAFGVAAATSVGLVVSYLRLAVGGRFALLWAGSAQMIYLVLFSLAFFLEGYTGLTITIFSVLTLFVVMQLTGRIDWSRLLGGDRPAAPPAPAEGEPPTDDGRSFHAVGGPA